MHPTPTFLYLFCDWFMHSCPMRTSPRPPAFLKHILYSPVTVTCLPLSTLGVDTARVKQAGQIAGQSSTRRLGDYRIKCNYSEIDLLR